MFNINIIRIIFNQNASIKEKQNSDRTRIQNESKYKDKI